MFYRLLILWLVFNLVRAMLAQLRGARIIVQLDGLAQACRMDLRPVDDVIGIAVASSTSSTE